MEDVLKADMEAAKRAHQEIGRYTVQFSVLVWSMRRIWASYISNGDEQRQRLLELAFGDLGAAAIGDAFFAMCRALTAEDLDERTICDALRKKVLAELENRNDLAHGDWLIGHWVSSEPKLVRLKAARRKQTENPTERPLKALGEDADRVEALAVAVWQLGFAVIGKHQAGSVKEALELTDEGDVVMPEGAVWMHPSPHQPL